MEENSRSNEGSSPKIVACSTSTARINEIRHEIETKHHDSNGGGGFGETFCAHIHAYDLGFVDLAQHFNITMGELADVTADHIRRLKPMEGW